MEATVVLFAVSLVVGLVVGVLAGLLGVGGGMLLVPAFKLGYAMDSLMCTATSLFTIIPTSVSGAISHVRNKTCLPKLGVAAGVGGACLSPVGVWLATLSPDWCVMGAAALIIGYSAITMFRKALKAPKVGKGAAAAASPEAAAAERAAAIERAHREAPAIGWREVAVGFAIGLGAGLASGYVGVGGGFIMVPLMMSILRVPMKLTSGTSLIAVMILAVPGVVTQALLGNINWVAGIAVACGSIPGAALGAKLIPKVPERQLRFLFAGFLVVAAALLVVNQLGLWG
ncbi:sulfite exporter TauE/SafE family protein [Adlercreutzia sp. R21]|uniref:sulfite exporter TauE/SafE family protein n=1 Tax=Adlercreutzia wanghongyangiae TaxID=3111451 RepID=UPI002DBBF914|nr:sulfite exporter TauE/SafE family protein [Adlercreutzia sp. R21]MEC4183595.1 sulfite exporter TauE/SafE family protein [Adlercreutzia sp. R21]